MAGSSPSDITGEVIERYEPDATRPDFISVSGGDYELDFDNTVTRYDRDFETGVEHETEYKNGEMVRDREIVRDPEDGIHSIVTEQEGDRTTVTTKRYDTDENGREFVYTDSREIFENGNSLYTEKNKFRVGNLF